MKLLKTKLNTIEVNEEGKGITVSKITTHAKEETPKKLMTWKETVLRSQSDNNAMLINIIATNSTQQLRKSMSQCEDFKSRRSLDFSPHKDTQ